MTGLTLITPPAAEPLSLATQVKPHLRITADFTDHDGYIQNVLMPSAREKVEEESSRPLIDQVWEMTLDHFPCPTRKNPFAHIYLPLGNVKTVDEFAYTDEAGDEAAVDSSVYGVDVSAEPARIFLKPSHTWPATVLYPAAAVRIRFTCGKGTDGTNVPWAAKQAILLTIGHYYENRESVVISDGGSVAIEVPEAARLLIDGHLKFYPFPNE